MVPSAPLSSFLFLVDSFTASSQKPMGLDFLVVPTASLKDFLEVVLFFGQGYLSVWLSLWVGTSS